MIRENLTRKEGAVVAYIELFMAQFGRMPTFKQVIHNLPINRSTLERALNSLEGKGYLTRYPAGTIPAVLKSPTNAEMRPVGSDLAARAAYHNIGLRFG